MTGMDAPDYARLGLALREIMPPPVLRAQFPPLCYLRTYTLGECTVIVTKETGRYHLSIAHHKRYPHWLEISAAWYKIVLQVTGRASAMILPELGHYVNHHEYCMQIHEINWDAHATCGKTQGH